MNKIDEKTIIPPVTEEGGALRPKMRLKYFFMATPLFLLLLLVGLLVLPELNEYFVQVLSEFIKGEYSRQYSISNNIRQDEFVLREVYDQKIPNKSQLLEYISTKEVWPLEKSKDKYLSLSTNPDTWRAMGDGLLAIRRTVLNYSTPDSPVNSDSAHEFEFNNGEALTFVPLAIKKKSIKYYYNLAKDDKGGFENGTLGIDTHKNKELWKDIGNSLTGVRLKEMQEEFLNTNYGNKMSYLVKNNPNTPGTDHRSMKVILKGMAMRLLNYATGYFNEGDYISSSDSFLTNNRSITVPDVSDMKTLINFAKMAANAYKLPSNPNWEHLGNDTTHRGQFGWEGDGIRGHVFSNRDNSTVIISFKGTKPTVFSPKMANPSLKDKFNDNRLYSCCCATSVRISKPVCDCHIRAKICDGKCLKDSLKYNEDLYYYAGAKIVLETANRYRQSQIILTGHSLGGTVASLLGVTFGLPAVGFESPGDMLAASRLGLPVDRDIPVWHVGHNADPIFTGTCVGPLSVCNLGGYAMESKCHIGKIIEFDAVGKLNWRPDILRHLIEEVIYLLLEPWEKRTKSKAPVPVRRMECNDCDDWSFV